MIMKKLLIFTLTILLIGSQIKSQQGFQTKAERSDFTSTSNYNDVMNFIDQLKKSSKYIRTESIAQSAEGRSVPLLVIGNPLPKSPSHLTGDDRIVIYIQTNIHAGEVEGKEATLMFARDLLSEKNPELLKHVVFLICPLFNPDGNEKISPLNRTNQNGPVNGVGVRHNGQMLDLNRDAMKAESPEVQGVIKNVFNAWDPSIFMDCHTTDGSFHVEPVTFAWMVNPNGSSSLIEYMRLKMMPEISSTLLKKFKTENCYYGEFFDLMNPGKGWLYDAAEPRYMTNYYGLRNRLSVLNENYVHADFKSRVEGCYYLIKSLSDYAFSHYSEIKKLLKVTDNETIQRGMNPVVTDSFAIEYKVRPLAEKVTIKTYEAEPSSDPGIWPPFKRTDKQVNVTVPYYIDYYPVRSVRFPFAWILTINDKEVLDLLRLHGIKIERVIEPLKCDAERFEITGLKAATNLNQGHYLNSISGRYINETIDFPAGTIIIKASQPLANLAAYLLEPQSNDGLLTWNYLDRYLVPQWGYGFNQYPVYRIVNPVELKTQPVL
jgi:murein tripeptide amidase MpaA